MNTALGTFRVAYFGRYWIVTRGDESFTCTNKAQLLTVLSGGTIPREATAFVPPPRTETMEEFLARGGKVTKVEFPRDLPPPPPVPEKNRPAPSRITLASLGLVFRQPSAPAPEPKEPPADDA